MYYIDEEASRVYRVTKGRYTFELAPFVEKELQVNHLVC